MEYRDLSSITIEARQRDIDQTIVTQLEESILSKGLLHPITILRKEDGKALLIAGEHRLHAVSALHSAEKLFTFDGNPVPLNQIPCTSVFDLSPADLLELELEENVIRAEIKWQDKARAIAAIHKLRVSENPSHTFTKTAEELAQRAGQPRAHGWQRTNVRNSLILAENLDRVSVSKARNATEALGILLKEENARVEAELITRKQIKAPDPSTSIVVHNADFTTLLPTFPENEIDLICADLPYGIGADSQGFRKRVVEAHHYDDSPANARSLMQSIIVEGFRIAKPRANMFVFGDVDLFPFFKECCLRMGWKPFRTPIIWQKSQSEGLAPWGREGPRRTYEMIFFATKGNRGLYQSPTDILTESRVARNLRRYGPEKPVGLMTQLIECATMPGELVLDPCCGSGATLTACRRLKRRAIGIELDTAAYNLSVVAANRDVEQEERLEELA